MTKYQRPMQSHEQFFDKPELEDIKLSTHQFDDYQRQQQLYLSETQIKEQDKIKELLYHLKTDLIASGKEVNPYGKLALCIEKIQETINLHIIDVDDLNARIRGNAIKPKHD